MVAIPTTVFGILSMIIIVLSGVVVRFYFANVKLYQEKSDLQDKRLDDAILVRERYDEVMGKFSQSFDLFVAKLEAKDK